MDKQVISYKLQKYQTKLRSNPSNNVYQQKVTQYGKMVGGIGGNRPWIKSGNNYEYSDSPYTFEYIPSETKIIRKINNGTRYPIVHDFKINDIISNYTNYNGTSKSYFYKIRNITVNKNLIYLHLCVNIGNGIEIIKINANDDDFIRGITYPTYDETKTNKDYLEIKNYIPPPSIKERIVALLATTKKDKEASHQRNITVDVSLGSRLQSLKEAATPKALPERKPLTPHELISGRIIR